MHIQSQLVKRGSILVLQGSNRRRALEFMFNPEQISRRRGWLHGSEPIPGRSSPAYGGGAGDADTFSFVLPLDADRGFLGRRQQSAKMDNADVVNWLGRKDGGGTFLADINEREDLRPYIDSFKRFLLPDANASQGSFRAHVPQRIWIDLGSALAGEVQIDDIEEDLWRFTNTMTVMRANLTINGHMIEESNVTSSAFMRKYTGSGTELPDLVQNDAFIELPNVFEEGGLF